MLKRWVCALGIAVTVAGVSLGQGRLPGPPPQAGAPSQADAQRYADKVRARMDEVRARMRSNVRDLDYAWFVYETTPRLSGLILAPESMPIRWRLGPPPGAVVLVGECELRLEEMREVSDVAFVGLGADKSWIKLKLRTADRVSLNNLTINCDSDSFADLRHEDSLQVSRCVVIRYNSGAGGSTAMNASSATILIDGCIFDGRDGRAVGRGHWGTAFDFGGTNPAYVRNTHFVDNVEILRTESCVFDTCTSFPPTGRSSGVMIDRRSPVYSRGNDTGMFTRDSPVPFVLASDDFAYVAAARANKQTGEALADQMLREFRPHSTPQYWCALLRHTDGEIRRMARERLTELGFGAALNRPPVDIDEALRQIVNGVGDPDLNLSILEMGSAALEPLRRTAQNGPEAVKAPAELLLRALEAAPMLQDQAIFSRVAGMIDSSDEFADFTGVRRWRRAGR